MPRRLTDEEIIKGVVQAKSIQAYARQQGIPKSTFYTELDKRGIRSKVKAALAKTRRTLKVVPPPQEEDVVSEVEILTQRNKELEKVVRVEREVDVRDERVLRRLETALQSSKPLYTPRASNKKTSADDHEFALLFSDLHSSEVVRSEATLGMNEYNWKIMLERMARIQESVLSYQANRPYPIRKLHLWMLGDMLSGDIHDDLLITNDRPIEEATVQLALDVSRWIEEFIPHFEEISIVGVPGNHPRRTKVPTMKQPWNNSDWTSYNIMKIQLRNYPDLAWNIPKADFATTTVAERWRVLLMHGDGIRSTMPGVPWGGVVRRVTTLEQQFQKAKQPLDYVVLGHFHTANQLEGVGTKTFMNGSVKGMDEYSLKRFGSGRAPSQLLLTFHPKRGHTDTSQLDLEPVHPGGKA